MEACHSAVWRVLARRSLNDAASAPRFCSSPMGIVKVGLWFAGHRVRLLMAADHLVMNMHGEGVVG